MSSTPPWVTALRELQKRPLTEEELQRFAQEIINAPHDRNVALGAEAFLERILEQFLKRWLVPHLNSDDRAALFGPTGIISSFSAQIRIAYAFGLFDKAIRSDIDRIRLIRNTFAHSPVPVRFDMLEIVAACEGLAHLPNFRLIDLPAGNDTRNRYITNCSYLSNMFTAAILEQWPASCLPLTHRSYPRQPTASPDK